MKGWDPDNLNKIIDASQISQGALSSACGICMTDLSFIRNGKKSPSVAMLLKLSDFFAVPTDYILGRFDKETAEAIINDYPRRFQELRRASWESYLVGRRNIPEMYIGREYEGPWPYNLLDDIFSAREYWSDVITDDQMDGLKRAISMLPEKHATAVMCYYYDGLSLSETGARFGVTRERARQMIVEALRVLRHPSRANLILKGASGADAEREIIKRRAELEKEREALNIIEEEIKKRTEEIPDYAALRAEAVQDVNDILIYNLGLSSRSYNCLARSNIYTVGELLARAKKGIPGGLWSIRALGAKSLKEILSVIKDVTGEDLFPLYARPLHIIREVDKDAECD